MFPSSGLLSPIQPFISRRQRQRQPRGNEVSIFWQPVWMTEDDYEGYLIEAWVCHAVRRFSCQLNMRLPRSNSSMMVIQVEDDPGCDLPSSARIYTVEKHGYTDYRMIAWPGFDSTTPLLLLNPMNLHFL